MTTTPDPIFSIQNLNFYYGNFLALSQINMDILANKVTALIGPSGCGKSTFLRCLNRMNDTISSTLWLSVICTIGWLAGKSITNLAPFLNRFEYAALALVLVLVTFKIGTAWISRKIAKE